MNKALEALDHIKTYSRLDACKRCQYYKNGKCENNIGDCMWKDEINIIETALKEKEQQDSILKILKEVIQFGVQLPKVEPNKDNGFDVISAVGMQVQKEIENKERELLRQWVLKTCFPKELKALEIIVKKPYLFLFTDFNLTYEEFVEQAEEDYGDDLPTKEQFDLIKEVVK